MHMDTDRNGAILHAPNDVFDAIVIGGSYAGLSAAMQLARARRRVGIVDAGKPRNRFAAASHGFFGQDGARPAEMIAQAREQVLAYPTVTFIGSEAVSARRDNGHVTVQLTDGRQLTGTGIVLAHGIEDVLPDVSGMRERWGVSVLHCPYCHGYEVGGKRLGVLSATPGSAQQALLIADWGPTTFFLNGRDDLEPELCTTLSQRGVAIEPAAVATLEGEGTSLAAVRLDDGRDVSVEAMFVTPMRRMSPLAASLGCEVDEGVFGPTIRVDGMRATTVPGVFAAGDATIGAGNASLAVADGAVAGAALHKTLIGL
jgi:thioredoxin reductase